VTLSYRNRPYAHYLLGWLFGPNPCSGADDDQGASRLGRLGRYASITKCCLRSLIQDQGYLGQQIKTATPLSDRKGSGTFCKDAAGVSNSLPRYRWEPLDLAGVLDCRNRSACERPLEPTRATVCNYR
jgi:hypothetical protein